MKLGIDFGTCYSSAALLLDGTLKPIKEPLNHGYSFPSSVFISEQGEILVGQAAENAKAKNLPNYRHEFKRDLGSPDPYTLGTIQMLPEELVTEILKKLKIEADKVTAGRGEKLLTEVILTVPATYQPYKRRLMQEAATKAGFSQIELLEEPVAAAIYYSRHAPVNEGDIILVYDLGGGTFDATLIQKQGTGYQILGMPRGIAHCGGIDFDRQIFQELKSNCSVELRQRLEAKDAWRARAIVSERCRELKHQLSEQEEATIDILISDEVFSLTRDVFNSAIASLIEETIDCCEQLLRSASMDWRQVNQMLLVGGSCRIPLVREAINRRFGRQPLLVDEPELAVCLGAAIFGNIQVATQVKEAEQKAKIEAELQRKKQEEAKRQSQLEAQEERQRLEEEKKRTETPELKSARGVDYTKLRDLLAAGKWKEADQETGKVMWQAAVGKSEGWLSKESIDNFPCEDLRTINQLWLHYSQGKFGFSVQKEIYESLGGTRECNLKIWDKFLDRVGWRKDLGWRSWPFGGSCVMYSDLTFNLDGAPLAHLPVGVCRIRDVSGPSGGRASYRVEDEGRSWMGGADLGCLFFSRVKTCNL